MVRIPTDVREQLTLAAQHGHNLSVAERGPWPEHGDPHPKFYLSCTCGYEGRAVRSRKAINASLIWHLGKAVGEIVDAERDKQRNGVTPRPPASNTGVIA